MKLNIDSFRIQFLYFKFIHRNSSFFVNLSNAITVIELSEDTDTPLYITLASYLFMFIQTSKQEDAVDDKCLKGPG